MTPENPGLMNASPQIPKTIYKPLSCDSGKLCLDCPPGAVVRWTFCLLMVWLILELNRKL